MCVSIYPVGWNCPVPMCQCARAQGSRAGHTHAPRHYTWPSHLLGLLILHSSPWQGNEPRRVAGSPHVTTMMGAYGRVQRATEDHALWDQGWYCLNYRSSPGPLGALTAPQEVGHMPWAPDKQHDNPVKGCRSGNPEILKGCEKMQTFPIPEVLNHG